MHYVREDIKVMVESGIFSETVGLCFPSADIPEPSAEEAPADRVSAPLEVSVRVTADAR